MINHYTDKVNLERIKKLQTHFVSKRIPSSGSISLTYSCNLQCTHCYLGKSSSSMRSSGQELSTEKWFDIIDQITDAGCLNLLISGGEPLIRKDFGSIYRKAVTNGILVTVFTNGTLFSEEILALFSELPPQAVEISIYGASPTTYEKATGIDNAFGKCLEGIINLNNRGIRFKLKTMLLNSNFHEIKAIKNIAARFGVDFRMDPAITACLDGDKTPLSCRVSPEEAVQADLTEPGRRERYQGYYEKYKNPKTGHNLFNCGAGLTNFHINPEGILLPCMMLKSPAADLKSSSFTEGWENTISSIRTLKADKEFICNACDKRGLCNACPAYFELESGSPQVRSEYLCAIAEKRFQALNGN